MQVTKWSISKTHITWNEPFDLSVTVKMGSNEAISSNYDGYVMIVPCMNNKTTLNNYSYAYDSSGSRIVSKETSITKGAQKTFTFKGIYLDPSEFYITSTTKLNPIDYTLSQTGDNGAKRGYPLGFTVHAIDGYGESGRWFETDVLDVATFLFSRLAPTIGNIRLLDGHPYDPYSKINSYICGVSRPIVQAESVILDPLDPTITATHCHGAAI